MSNEIFLPFPFLIEIFLKTQSNKKKVGKKMKNFPYVQITLNLILDVVDDEKWDEHKIYIFLHSEKNNKSQEKVNFLLK